MTNSTLHGDGRFTAPVSFWRSRNLALFAQTVEIPFKPPHAEEVPFERVSVIHAASGLVARKRFCVTSFGQSRRPPHPTHAQPPICSISALVHRSPHLYSSLNAQ